MLSYGGLSSRSCSLLKPLDRMARKLVWPPSNDIVSDRAPVQPREGKIGVGISSQNLHCTLRSYRRWFFGDADLCTWLRSPKSLTVQSWSVVQFTGWSDVETLSVTAYNTIAIDYAGQCLIHCVGVFSHRNHCARGDFPVSSVPYPFVAFLAFFCFFTPLLVRLLHFLIFPSFSWFSFTSFSPFGYGGLGETLQANPSLRTLRLNHIPRCKHWRILLL